MLSSGKPSPSTQGNGQLSVVDEGLALLFCLLTPLNRPAFFLQVAAIALAPCLMLSVALALLPNLGGVVYYLSTVAAAGGYIVANALLCDALEQKHGGKHVEVGPLLAGTDWPVLVKTALLGGVVMTILGTLFVPVGLTPLLMPLAGYFATAERLDPADAVKVGLLQLGDGSFISLLFVLLPALALKFFLSTLPSFVHSVAGIMNAGNAAQQWIDLVAGWGLSVILLAFVATAIADRAIERNHV